MTKYIFFFLLSMLSDKINKNKRSNIVENNALDQNLMYSFIKREEYFVGILNVLPTIEGFRRNEKTNQRLENKLEFNSTLT